MKGYPDDFGVSIFPQFGPFTEVTGSEAVLSLATTPIISIAAKGVIYNAHLQCVDVNQSMLSSIVLTVDGETLSHYSPSVMIDYQYFNSDQYPLFLVYYEPDAPHFRVCVRPGLTFSSSFVMSYNNIAINIIEIVGKAVYADIV